MRVDPAISTLLDLDGSILDQGNGYWIKIEARLTEITERTPHGIHYSLTLHEPHGKRILGYDNAHAAMPPKKHKYAGRVRTFDHKHRYASDHGIPYEFTNAQQLINDFFADVDRILQTLGM